MKTSWRYLCKTSWRCLEDVLKTSWRCLEDLFARRLEDVLKTSWRCLEDVLKTSWKRYEDVLKTYNQDEYADLDEDLEDVFWRRMSKANIFLLIKASWRRMFAGTFQWLLLFITRIASVLLDTFNSFVYIVL